MDTANYGPKAPPLNGNLGVVPRLKSWKNFIKCTEPINTTAKAARMELWRERLEPLDASVHLNISPDEHLPAGAENPWTTWKALNRLLTQVGRSRLNMLKWGFSNEQETYDCGIRQTMYNVSPTGLPMMDTACSPQDLTTANGIAIGCAKHWDDLTDIHSWWKEKNDDDCVVGCFKDINFLMYILCVCRSYILCVCRCYSSLSRCMSLLYFIIQII